MEKKLYTLDGFKAARKRAGLTQKEVSDILGIHLKTVRNWEQGIAVPEFDTLMALCDLFSCDLDYLAGRIKEPTHDIQTVCEITSLSADAVEKLIEFNHDDADDKLLMKALSRLINQEGFYELLLKYSSHYGHLKIYEHLLMNNIEHDLSPHYNLENNTVTLPINGFIEFSRQSVSETMTMICSLDPIARHIKELLRKK